VRNEEVLHRVKEKRNVVHTVKGREVDWIDHIWRRNCLIKHVIGGNSEEKKEVTGMRGGRCKQLLYDLKEKRRHWTLKEETLADTENIGLQLL